MRDGRLRSHSQRVRARGEDHREVCQEAVRVGGEAGDSGNKPMQKVIKSNQRESKELWSTGGGEWVRVAVERGVRCGGG